MSHQSPVDQPDPALFDVPEPSDAERARTITETVTRGALATTGADYPYCSAANVVVDERGRPITFVSTMAAHTRNLLADPRASLLLLEVEARASRPDEDATPAAAATDRLALGRVTLQGDMALLERGGGQHQWARERYLARHPQAAYVDYGDFLCFRLELAGVRYVGGFGRMSWVDVSSYERADPDLLSAVAAGAIEHMNTDHADGLLLCARALGAQPDAEQARMTALDRYGFELAITTPQGQGTTRIGFPQAMTDPARLRQTMAAIVRQARTL